MLTTHFHQCTLYTVQSNQQNNTAKANLTCTLYMHDKIHNTNSVDSCSLTKNFHQCAANTQLSASIFHQCLYCRAGLIS